MMENYRTFCPVCLKYVHMGDLVTCGKAAECGLKTNPPIEEIPLDFDRTTTETPPCRGCGYHECMDLRCGAPEKTPKTATSTQIGGNHYASQAIQPIDYILENGLGFIEGNVIKYVSRYQKKNGVEDLKKARHYLDMLIERLEKASS